MASPRCFTFFFIIIVLWRTPVDPAALNPVSKDTAAVDLLILIDGTYYVTEANFRIVLQAVLNYIETLPVAPNQVNVGAISYSVVPRRIEMTADMERLRADIPNMYYEGLTALTHVAFDEALTVLTAQKSLRPYAKKVVILVTESMSLYQAESKKSAEKLLNAGVEMWSVGIGPNVRQLELLDYTGNLSRVFLSNKYDELPAIDLGLEGQSSTDRTNTMSTLSTSPGGSQSSSSVNSPSTTSDPTGSPRLPGESTASITQTSGPSASMSTTTTLPGDRDLTVPTASIPSTINGEVGDGSVVFNSSEIDGVCFQAVGYKGFGFAPHQRECSKFIQCYRSENGLVTASVRSCPKGQHWDQSNLTCANPGQACCPDPCMEKGEGQTFRMEGSCGQYWQCSNGASKAMSCPLYFAYIPGSGCRFMPVCSFSDLSSCRPLGKCELAPLRDNSKYKQPATNGSQIFNCWTSMEVDLASCSCRPMKSLITNCPLVTYLNFTATTKNSTNTNNNAVPSVPSNSTCKATGNSESVGNNSNALNNTNIITPACSDSIRAVTLSFQYLSSTNRSAGSTHEVLVRSNDCSPGQDGIFVVSEDKTSLNVRVISPTGYALTASLPLWGLNQTLWRDVYVQYFGGNLFLEVKAGSLVYNTYLTDGMQIPVGSCGWKVGIPDKLSGFLSEFTGDISQVLLSRCNEYGF